MYICNIHLSTKSQLPITKSRHLIVDSQYLSSKCQYCLPISQSNDNQTKTQVPNQYLGLGTIGWSTQLLIPRYQELEPSTKYLTTDSQVPSIRTKYQVPDY